MKVLITAIVLVLGVALGYSILKSDKVVEPASTPAPAGNTSQSAVLPEAREQIALVEQTAELSQPADVQIDAEPSLSAEEEYSQSSFDSFLSEDDEHVLLDAAGIYGVSLDDLRTMTMNLGADGNQDHRAYEAEYELELELGNSSGVTLDMVRCSSDMCSVIFSSYDAEQRDSILENTFRNEVIKEFSRGGLLRPVHSDGIYYGLAIVVLDNGKPLKLR